MSWNNSTHHFLPLVNTPRGRLYYLQSSVQSENAGRVPVRSQGVNLPFSYPQQKGDTQGVVISTPRHTRGWARGPCPGFC